MLNQRAIPTFRAMCILERNVVMRTDDVAPILETGFNVDKQVIDEAIKSNADVKIQIIL